MRLVVLTKAKYKRRWKGADGKWRYDYYEKKGKQSAVEAPTKTYKQSDLYSERDMQRVVKLFGRRDKEQGGPQNIESRKQLDIVLTKTNVAFISAGRNPAIEADRALSDADITARDKALKSDLKKMGFVWTPAMGHYGSLPEGSIIVMTHDSNDADMAKLGEKYNQDAVLFSHKGHNEMLLTTGDRKGEVDAQGEGYSLVPDAEDYYTEVSIKGKKTKFSLALEWGKSLLHKLVKVWR